MAAGKEQGLAIPRGVWVLGWVSLLMDISSEMIHSLLPVFMVSALGAGALAVGLVEGVAEATALVTKVFSGALSDHLRRRKGLTVLGYGLGALSKPLFAMAGSVGSVLLARFIDRVGKGTRGAPRDALLAEITPEPVRGAAYGLRQSMDTVGAFIGPIVAILLMLLWSGDYRAVFWFAAVPGALAVALLAVGVHEPETPAASKPARSPVEWGLLGRMGRAYWRVVVVGAVFTLARFSEAFLILRGRELGLSDALAPGVMILMSAVYALTAYPVGRLSDRMGRTKLLGAGLFALVAADLALARAQGLALGALGVGLWGLHMGLTQGLLSAMVADAAPAELRGTAFGLFNLAGGAAMLAASCLAGLLWAKAGAAATFYAGALFSIAALALLLPPGVAQDAPGPLRHL